MKGPEGALGFKIAFDCWGCRRRIGGFPRIESAFQDPALEYGDVRLCELLLGGHLQIGIAVTHGFQEETAFRVTRDECGP